MAQAALTVAGPVVGTIFYVIARTTFFRRTAAGRIETLEELYKMVQGRHERFVKVILPRLRELGKHDDSFLGADATKRALEA